MATVHNSDFKKLMAEAESDNRDDCWHVCMAALQNADDDETEALYGIKFTCDYNDSIAIRDWFDSKGFIW